MRFRRISAVEPWEDGVKLHSLIRRRAGQLFGVRRHGSASAALFKVHSEKSNDALALHREAKAETRSQPVIKMQVQVGCERKAFDQDRAFYFGNHMAWAGDGAVRLRGVDECGDGADLEGERRIA